MSKRLGIPQGTWQTLRGALLKAKVSDIHVGLKQGADTAEGTDAHDVPLEILLTIVHIDVDQGESTLLLLSCEPALCKKLGSSSHLLAILIDGGRDHSGGGMVERALQSMGVHHLDAVIVSHFDDDHVEGIKRLIDPSWRGDRSHEKSRERRPGNDDTVASSSSSSSVVASSAVTPVRAAAASSSSAASGWTPITIGLALTRKKIGATDPEWVAFDTLCKERSIERRDVTEKFSIELDCHADMIGFRRAFRMTCLCANTAASSSGKDPENDYSLAWLLEFGRFRYYTAGDLSSPVEDRLAAGGSFTDKRLTALKCGHHGSDGSTSKAFLAKARPQLAFISAGLNEGYRHPHADTLLRLYASRRMQAVYMTTCYFGRPFVTPDYLKLQLDELKAQWRAVIEELHKLDKDSQWPPEAQPCPVDAPADRARRDADGATALRSALMDLYKDLSLSEIKLGSGTSEDLAIWVDAEEHAKTSVEAFQQLRDDHYLVIASLRQGINVHSVASETVAPTAASATAPRSSRKPVATYSAKTLTEQWITDIAGRLANACNVASAGLAFFRRTAAKTTGERAQMFATGNKHLTGTVSLRMRLEDCYLDTRVCFVHSLAFGWQAYPRGAPSSGASAWEPVLSQASLALKPPGSPGKFVPHREDRAEQKKRIPIMSASAAKERTPTSKGTHVYIDEDEIMDDPEEVDDEDDEDYLERGKGSSASSGTVRRASSRKRKTAKTTTADAGTKDAGDGPDDGKDESVKKRQNRGPGK